jgi:hypothetical protein
LKFARCGTVLNSYLIYTEKILETGELILAAHVRELAARLVEERWLKVADGLKLSKETPEGRDERARIKAEWFSNNPIESFFAEAQRVLQEVAIQIKAQS